MIKIPMNEPGQYWPNIDIRVFVFQLGVLTQSTSHSDNLAPQKDPKFQEDEIENQYSYLKYPPKV